MKRLSGNPGLAMVTCSIASPREKGMKRAYWSLEKAHRAILDKETGWVKKEPGGRLNVALLYPNTYRVGMANLGLAVVYRLLNQRTDALCERAFLPDRALSAEYNKSKAPLLTLESSRPVADFDLVLVTFPFENDAGNLAAMLEMSGLGLDAEKRRGPLVICGGVTPMLNPEPYAGLMDGFLLGEAEVVLEPFIDVLLNGPDLGREELLLSLGREVKGFYAPRFYRAGYHADGTLASFAPAADIPERIEAPKYHGPASGLAQSVFRAPGPEFGDMRLMEVGRGCGHGCRFCAAGHVLRPPRLGRADDFRDEVLATCADGGRVGLVSAAVSDIHGVGGLAAGGVAAGGGISVSSLRADRLDPELARALVEGGLKTAALAPEAGSQRLRQVINKRLTGEQLFQGVETLMQAGLPNLRLYFMVGLPGETDEDLDELIALAKKVRQQVVSAWRPRGRLGLVTLSLNAFVPKPWTPFQWEPMAELKTIKRRMKRIQDELKNLGNIKVINRCAQIRALAGGAFPGGPPPGRGGEAFGQGRASLTRPSRRWNFLRNFTPTAAGKRMSFCPGPLWTTALTWSIFGPKPKNHWQPGKAAPAPGEAAPVAVCARPVRWVPSARRRETNET